MYAFENLQRFITATDDLAATGDSTALHVVQPITVYAVGTIATTAIAGTTGVLKFDISTPNGASYSRGDGNLGTCNIVANTSVGRTIINYITPVNLNPGDIITPEITTAVGTSGTGFHFVLYRVREEVKENITTYVVVTA